MKALCFTLSFVMCVVQELSQATGNGRVSLGIVQDLHSA